MKKFQHNIIFPLSVLLYAGLLNGQTYTFTNAGATGREGPTQAQIDSNYTGTNLAGNVTINTQGIQEWVVPADGYYTIETKGAAGAIGDLTQSNFQGGNGAVMVGGFNLTALNTLKIVVGQKGISGGQSEPGGGGGGSFVYSGQIGGMVLYIAAGGGGGGRRRRRAPSGDPDARPVARDRHPRGGFRRGR